MKQTYKNYLDNEQIKSKKVIYSSYCNWNQKGICKHPKNVKGCYSCKSEQIEPLLCCRLNCINTIKKQRRFPND